MTASTPLRAEIVAIGDELTHGHCIDTNSAWLARVLEGEGCVVARFHVVSDVESDIAAVFAEAGARADVIVATGGLGPTLDDRTREAAARAAGVALAHDENAWEQIRAWFARLGRHEVPASNRRQASFPAGADVLPNSCGTAPGFAMTMQRAQLFSLPGVPSEMKAMVVDGVLPRLRARNLSTSATVFAVLQVLGPSEAALGERIARFMVDGRNPAVGITASGGLLSVRVAARAPAQAAAEAACARDVADLRALLGEDLVAEGEAPLAQSLADLLRQRGLSVAVAESCTAGMLASALGDIPGISAVFAGGVVAYANAVKVRDLLVPAAWIEAHGAVSEPVAAAMADGAAERFGTRVSVAITGIAGPDGGTDEKPVGLVCIATRVDGQTRAFRRRIANLGRDFVRRRATVEAIAALIRRLR